MFLYYGKQFTTAQVGARIAGVHCEKCGCEYYFVLSRIGTATSTAHYGLGQAAAVSDAQTRSTEEVDKRLTDEAELVPCPKCNWINEELVEGFRRGRFRHWGEVAVGAAIFGIAISLIIAWFIHLGPAVDRGSLPYFLICGPLIIVALAGSIVGLRWWLRRRIQPNRDYPLPPKLPQGTPPPLILDHATGDLVPASTVAEGHRSKKNEIQMQLGRHGLPMICCVCLQSAHSDHAFEVSVLPGVQLQIPRCTVCATRAKRRKWQLGLTVTAASLAVMTGLLFALRLEQEEFWILLVVSTLIASAIGAFVGHLTSSPATVKVIDASRGIFRIRFRNPEFTTYVPGD